MAVQLQVSDETWNKLMKRKSRPSHTFDSIISELLDKSEETK